MKTYYIMYNVGKVKYLVNYHDGIKTHNDGSQFFDIATFKNKKKMNSFIADLEEKGYVPRPFGYESKKLKITEKIKFTPAMKNLKGISHISLQNILTQKVYDMSNAYFKPKGKVGVEPETWAIYCYWDGEVFETFLYQSEDEYLQDIDKLNLKTDVIPPKEQKLFLSFRWNHFILHLEKGLPSEILGPFTRPEKNKEMKRLESKYDGMQHYFILLSIQGKIQTIQTDEICWVKEPQKLKSWEATLKGYDGGSDETDHLIKWYLADTQKQVEDDLILKGWEWDAIVELPEGYADDTEGVEILK